MENNEFPYDGPNDRPDEASPINIDNLTVEQRTQIDKIMLDDPKLSFGEAARLVVKKNSEEEGQVE